MKLLSSFKNRSLKAHPDQRGVVSTYVSIGIIGILGLISISFAVLMQTEYIQARDRQFNSQARLAAETAINDARQLVYKAIGYRLNLSQFIAEHDGDGDGDVDAVDYGGNLPDVNTNQGVFYYYDSNNDGMVNSQDGLLQSPYDTAGLAKWYDCGENINIFGFDGELDEERIGYTCIEVDGRPVKLVYNEISTDRSENILLQTRIYDKWSEKFFKANIQKLIVNWESDNPSNTPVFETAADHDQKLYPENKWKATAPMLKIQIIPLNIRDGWTQPALELATKTYFLYPTQYNDPWINDAAKITAYGGPPFETENNSIVNADCDGDKNLRCTVEIKGFLETFNLPDGTNYEVNATGHSPQTSVGNKGEPLASDDEMVYIVLVRPIYGKAKVELSATAAGNLDLRFVNQQINITANGSAGDLTYRLREIIPIRPKYNRPEYAIDSAEHICKVLIGEPDTGVNYDYSKVSNINQINVGGNQVENFCEELHPPII